VKGLKQLNELAMEVWIGKEGKELINDSFITYNNKDTCNYSFKQISIYNILLYREIIGFVFYKKAKPICSLPLKRNPR